MYVLLNTVAMFHLFHVIPLELCIAGGTMWNKGGML